MSWKILYLLFGIILVLPLFNFLLGVHPPRLPTNDHPKRYGLHFEKVSFATPDGLTLSGWFIPAANDSQSQPLHQNPSVNSWATILVGHGYPFDKANILRHVLFLHPRFHLLLFDFRYFGESEGAYTTAGLLETQDVQGAMAYLKSRDDVDSERVGAMGFSMSAAAFILARQPGLRAIVADSPYAYLERLIARQFFFLLGVTKWPFVELTKFYAWLFLGLRITGAAPAEAVRDLNIPLLIIHGESDSQIPLEHSQAIYDNADPNTTQLWVIPNAEHGAAHALEGHRYEVRVRQFFEENLCSPQS